jgi:hypothetical protein
MDILIMCLLARVFIYDFNTMGYEVCQWLSESGLEHWIGCGSGKDDLLI